MSLSSSSPPPHDLSPRKQPQQHPPPPLPPMSVHLFPRDPEHTDRERRGSQRVETVATFKFPTTDS